MGLHVCVCTAADTFWGPQAEAMANCFRQHGHVVDVVTDRTGQFEIGRTYDLLFAIGSANPLRPYVDLLAARKRIIYVIESIPTLTEADEFTARKLRILEQYIHGFDFVYVHTSRSIPRLHQMGVPEVEAVVWPYFPTLFIPPAPAEKSIDVLFLGTLSPHRAGVLRRLSRDFSVTVIRNLFHGASIPWYARAKIVLNVHFTPLKNFECRITEVLGCAGFLMTEALEPDNVFRDRKHLVVFDRDNLRDLVAHYLRDEAQRESIAAAGHAEVQKYSVDRFVHRVLERYRRLVV